MSCRSCSFAFLANPHSPVPSLCADSVNRMRCCSSSCSETAFLPNTGAGQAFRFRFRSFILPIAVADERSTSWRPIQFVRQRCCDPRSPSPRTMLTARFSCSLLSSEALHSMDTQRSRAVAGVCAPCCWRLRSSQPGSCFEFVLAESELGSAHATGHISGHFALKLVVVLQTMHEFTLSATCTTYSTTPGSRKSSEKGTKVGWVGETAR